LLSREARGIWLFLFRPAVCYHCGGFGRPFSSFIIQNSLFRAIVTPLSFAERKHQKSISAPPAILDTITVKLSIITYIIIYILKSRRVTEQLCATGSLAEGQPNHIA
jgi:hypothetical protein